jgi:hypothetical protein
MGRWLTWMIGLCLIAGPARADSDFIPVPLPPEVAPPPPAGIPPEPTAAPPAPAAPEPGAETERAQRAVRQEQELRHIEQRRSPTDLDDFRAREERELEHRVTPVPEGDAARVRGDIERARERIELERKIDRTEQRMRTRPGEPR